MSTMLNTSTHTLDSETETISHQLRSDEGNLNLTEFHSREEEGDRPFFSMDYFPPANVGIRVTDLGKGRLALTVGASTIFLSTDQVAKIAEVL